MASMARNMTRPDFAVSALRCFVAGYAVLSLVGCTSGTLTGAQQSCESSFGLTEAKKVSCAGSVDTVSGSPSLSVIEIGEDLDGAYRLKTTITIGSGTAKASVTDVDDHKVEGEVSPGDPLKISAVVYPEPAAGAEEDEEEVEVHLKVEEGKEIRDLRFEATLVKQR